MSFRTYKGGRIEGTRFIQIEDENTRKSVGYLNYRYASGNTCEITDIQVDSAYQRQGLGRQLMEAFFFEVKERVQTVYLFCAVDNISALAFYFEMEFKARTSVNDFYPTGGAFFLTKRVR